MAHQKLDNYLRMHRKGAGLSLQTLADIVGAGGQAQVSRYERMQTLPPLTIALAYETVFRIPISEIFAGVHDNIKGQVEDNLQKLEDELKQRSGAGPKAGETARLLEWLEERRMSD